MDVFNWEETKVYTFIINLQGIHLEWKGWATRKRSKGGFRNLEKEVLFVVVSAIGGETSIFTVYLFPKPNQNF